MKPTTQPPVDKQELPGPIREAIDNFFTSYLDGRDHVNIIDNITQDALYHIDEFYSQDAGDTFFFMRNIRSLIDALKPYAQ